MSDTGIKEKQTAIIEALRGSLTDISFLTLKYLDVFDKKDFFLFADSDKRSALYKKEYRSFIRKLSTPVNELSALMAELSSIFIEAERIVEPSAPFLEDVFLSYLSFERTLADFFSSTEAILKSAALSVSDMADAAKRLNSSVSSLIQKIL